MEYISAKEAAEKWGAHIRVVQEHCKSGRIPGAKKLGANWIIPSDTEKPCDARRFAKPSGDKGDFPLPRRNPFFIMTDLYRTPGSGDRVVKSLSGNPGAQALFAAQLAYQRGEIDRVYKLANGLLGGSTDFDGVIGVGLLLSLCAMYRGDIALWTQAKSHIAAAPCQSDADRVRLAFWLAATDSALQENTGFPADFCRGRLAFLPADSLAAARFFYAKYLYIAFCDAVTGLPDSGGARHENLLYTLPSICELLVSHSRSEGVVVSEIYLCMVCAVAYHNAGDDAQACVHIDRAIALALPDKLYAPLAEYSRQLDFLLYDRLCAVAPDAAQKVQELNTRLLDGWVVLHNALLDRHVSNELTTREREVARFAAYGLSNQEIAKRLYISVATVKQAIGTAIDKTGAKNRFELAGYI